MSKFIFAGAVAVGACAFALIGAPAAAADSQGEPSEANVLCFWDEVNFRGDVECVGVGNNDLTTLAGEAKSLSNDTGRPLCVYEDRGQGGSSLGIDIDRDFTDLSEVVTGDGGNWADRIHSTGSCA